jgi:hypothetical protein
MLDRADLRRKRLRASRLALLASAAAWAILSGVVHDSGWAGWAGFGLLVGALIIWPVRRVGGGHLLWGWDLATILALPALAFGASFRVVGNIELGPAWGLAVATGISAGMAVMYWAVSRGLED